MAKEASNTVQNAKEDARGIEKSGRNSEHIKKKLN
jgi:hypothetical protein